MRCPIREGEIYSFIATPAGWENIAWVDMGAGEAGVQEKFIFPKESGYD